MEVFRILKVIIWAWVTGHSQLAAVSAARCPLPVAFRKTITILTLIAFIFTSVSPSFAQLVLPAPGTMVTTSAALAPTILKGMRVYPDQPLRFDFIVNTGDFEKAVGGRPKVVGSDPTAYDLQPTASLENESKKLIRYFLAALTTPEQDLWVNLSPYEKDRIIPDSFGQTEMGRDLLAQDYILKQLTASIIYPEGETGKKFWAEVYKQAQQKYGTTDIPIDTFNKVWITPDSATVYVNGQTAVIKDSRLKVMLEADYVAANQQAERVGGEVPDPVNPALATQKGIEDRAIGHSNGETMPNALSPMPSQGSQDIAKAVLKDVVIPLLEKEVNEGANFAQLRQIYHAMVLATWFKRNLKESLLGKVYTDKNKVQGLGYEGSNVKGQTSNEKDFRAARFAEASARREGEDSSDVRRVTSDPVDPEGIWNLYVEAFKKGAFNYIKEEQDQLSGDLIPRKYFSGGYDYAHATAVHEVDASQNDMANAVNADNSVVVKTDLRDPDSGDKPTSSDTTLDSSDLTNPDDVKIFDETHKQDSLAKDNFFDVLNEVERLAKDPLGIDQKTLQSLHVRLTQGTRREGYDASLPFSERTDPARDHNIPGQYRRVQTHLGTMAFPKSENVAELVRDYLAWLNLEIALLKAEGENVLRTDIVQLAAEAHTLLNNIHPFTDGNGRLSRIMTLYVLYSFGFKASEITRKEYGRAVSFDEQDRREASREYKEGGEGYLIDFTRVKSSTVVTNLNELLESKVTSDSSESTDSADRSSSASDHSEMNVAENIQALTDLLVRARSNEDGAKNELRRQASRIPGGIKTLDISKSDSLSDQYCNLILDVLEFLVKEDQDSGVGVKILRDIADSNSSYLVQFRTVTRMTSLFLYLGSQLKILNLQANASDMFRKQASLKAQISDLETAIANMSYQAEVIIGQASYSEKEKIAALNFLIFAVQARHADAIESLGKVRLSKVVKKASSPDLVRETLLAIRALLLYSPDQLLAKGLIEMKDLLSSDTGNAEVGISVQGEVMDFLIELNKMTRREKQGLRMSRLGTQDPRYRRLEIIGQETLRLICQLCPENINIHDLDQVRGFLEKEQLDEVSRERLVSFLQRIAKGREHGIQGMPFLFLRRFSKDRKFLEQMYRNSDMPRAVRLYAWGLIAASSSFEDIADDEALQADAQYLIENINQISVPEILRSPFNKETIQVYSLAYLLYARKTMPMPIYRFWDQFKQMIQRVMDAKLEHRYENADSGFHFGGVLLQSAGPREFLFTVAHELGHTVLFADFNLSYESLNGGAIHEFVADLFYKSLAQKMGWPTDDFETMLGGTEDRDRVFNQQGGYALGRHEAGRSQIGAIMQAFQERSMDIEWSQLLRLSLEVLNSPDRSRVEGDFFAFIEAVLSKYKSEVLGSRGKRSLTRPVEPRGLNIPSLPIVSPEQVGQILDSSESTDSAGTVKISQRGTSDHAILSKLLQMVVNAIKGPPNNGSSHVLGDINNKLSELADLFSQADTDDGIAQLRRELTRLSNETKYLDFTDALQEAYFGEILNVARWMIENDPQGCEAGVKAFTTMLDPNNTNFNQMFRVASFIRSTLRLMNNSKPHILARHKYDEDSVRKESKFNFHVDYLQTMLDGMYSFAEEIVNGPRSAQADKVIALRFLIDAVGHERNDLQARESLGAVSFDNLFKNDPSPELVRTALDGVKASFNYLDLEGTGVLKGLSSIGRLISPYSGVEEIDITVRGELMDFILESIKEVRERLLSLRKAKRQESPLSRRLLAIKQNLLKTILTQCPEIKVQDVFGVGYYLEIDKLSKDEFSQLEKLFESLRSSRDYGIHPASFLLLRNFSDNEDFLRQIQNNMKLNGSVRLYAWGLRATLLQPQEIVENDELSNVANSLITNIASLPIKDILHSVAAKQVIQLYSLAYLLYARKTMPMPIYKFKESFKKIIERVMSAALQHRYFNADSDMNFGGELLLRGDSKEFMKIIAHEMGHTVLFSDVYFYGKELNGGAIHEFVADLFSLSIAQNVGWEVDIVNILEKNHLSAVMSRGWYAQEAHEAGRAQIASIRQAFERRSQNIDWLQFIRSALAILNSSDRDRVGNDYFGFISLTLQRYLVAKGLKKSANLVLSRPYPRPGVSGIPIVSPEQVGQILDSSESTDSAGTEENAPLLPSFAADLSFGPMVIDGRFLEALKGLGHEGITLAVSAAMGDWEYPGDLKNFDEGLGVYVIPDVAFDAIGRIAKADLTVALNLLNHIALRASTVEAMKVGDPEAIVILLHEKAHDQYKAAHPEYSHKLSEQMLVDELFAYFSSFINVYGSEQLGQKRPSGGLYWQDVSMLLTGNNYYEKIKEATRPQEEDKIKEWEAKMDVLGIKIVIATSYINSGLKNAGSMPIVLEYLKQARTLDEIILALPYSNVIASVELFSEQYYEGRSREVAANVLAELNEGRHKELSAKYQDFKRAFLSDRENAESAEKPDDAASPGNAAEADSADKGGIDLNTRNMNLRQEGGRIELGAVDPAMLSGNFDGLVPVVFSITRMTDPQAFFAGAGGGP